MIIYLIAFNTSTASLHRLVALPVIFELSPYICTGLHGLSPRSFHPLDAASDQISPPAILIALAIFSACSLELRNPSYLAVGCPGHLVRVARLCQSRGWMSTYIRQGRNQPLIERNNLTHQNGRGGTSLMRLGMASNPVVRSKSYYPNQMSIMKEGSYRHKTPVFLTTLP